MRGKQTRRPVRKLVATVLVRDMATTKTEFLVLPSGQSVPRAAWNLLVRLERRGFTLAAKDETLVVSPGSRLRSSEDAALRGQSGALIALIAGTSDPQ